MTSTTRSSSTSGATTAPAWRERSPARSTSSPSSTASCSTLTSSSTLIEQYGGVAELGGVHTAPHYAAAWAHAMNTPFQFGKQTASHLGGTRNPMVVAWPNRIKADRAMRTQFTHVIDIGPTILEAAGIPEPTAVDGIGQEPMDGTSFLYSLRRPPTRPSGTPSSTSRCSAPAPCTRTAGGRRRAPTVVPWDVSPATLAAVRPRGRLGSRPRRRVGALRPHHRLLPGASTWPPIIPTRCRSSRSCGGARPSATGCSRSWPGCR